MRPRAEGILWEDMLFPKHILQKGCLFNSFKVVCEMMMKRCKKRWCKSKLRQHVEKVDKCGIIFTYLLPHSSPTLFPNMTSSILEPECISVDTQIKVPKYKSLTCLYTLQDLQDSGRKWMLVGC